MLAALTGIRLDMRQGLSESRVRQIRQMPDGRMAIATTATIDIFDGTRFTSYPLPPDCAYLLPGYHGHRQLTCDKDGRVWLRNNRSLYVLDTRRGVVIRNVDSLLDRLHLAPSQIAAWRVAHAPDEYRGIKDVSCMERDSCGGLWIGTKENGIIYSNPRRMRQFRTMAGSAFPRVQNFVSPRTSQLSARFAPAATNCTLDYSKDGYAWLGTRHGVMVFDNEDKLTATIDSRDGLATDNIQCLIQDRRGDVWVATANGLSRIHIAGKDSFDIASYGNLDGIDVDGSEFRTCQIHRDGHGNITVGFAGGVVAFNPDSVGSPYYVYHCPRANADMTDGSPASIAATARIVAAATILILIIMCAAFWRSRRRKAKAVTGTLPGGLPTPTDGVIDKLKAPSSVEEADRLFLARLQETVEANISDEDFSVQALSEAMAMDRTGLYRRMQALTGMSPSNYIRRIRMEAAARLLAETTLPVADIATRTGFSTTKYFGKVFREYYGTTPAGYRSSVTALTASPGVVSASRGK